MMMHVNRYVFWLCVFVVAEIAILLWKLPKDVKPSGLAKYWRWITISTMLFFAFYSYYTQYYYYPFILPLMYVFFIVLMSSTLLSAAQQNYKPLWIRILVCLFLNLAISIDLFLFLMYE